MGLISVFIFYNTASGIQSKLSFSKEFQHCNVIVYDGEHWVMIDFDRSGIITRVIKCIDAQRLIRSLRVIPEVTAIISVNIKERHKSSWFPWWGRTCNEVCRYTSGIDVDFTFNPIQFYSRLLKYRHKRNFEVLSHWRRKHGIQRRQSAGKR